MLDARAFGINVRHYAAAARRRSLQTIERFDHWPKVADLLYEKSQPPALDLKRIKETLEARGHRNITWCGHRHISGWKDLGAFRIRLETDEGFLKLIYKNSVYSASEIPALVGLDVSPGYGEYLVYGSLPKHSDRLIPDVYQADEIEPGLHYRFLLEDLSSAYRKGDRTDPDRIVICGVLPDLHADLNLLKDELGAANLPVFDQRYAMHVLRYAGETLKASAETFDSPEVVALVAQWSEMAPAYEKAAQWSYQEQPLGLIHGDYNPSNVMLGRGHDGAKVIDFEWLGFGLPHMDLATALKGSPAVTDRCVSTFSERLGQRSREEDRQLFLFCAWQRGLLDAAFRIKQSQKTKASKGGYSSERVISRSARNAAAAYRAFMSKG